MFEFNSLLDYFNEVLFNLVHFSHHKNLKGQVFVNQLYYTGVQAVGYILFFSFITSFLLCFTFFRFFNVGDLNLFGEIIVMTGIRDFGPIVVGMILLLRSGTAITSEIGAMKCEKEISYILTLGVSPISYLVAPRIIGLILCNLFLSVYFFLFLFSFSSLFSFIFSNIPLNEMIVLVHKKVNFLDYFALFFKSTISGLLVGAICCYRGLQCKESITEIPQQNIFAVRHSLISLFFLHGLFILIEAFNSGVLRYLKYA